MAADPDRVRCRRSLGAGAAAGRSLAHPLPHVPNPGLAGRRLGGGPPRRRVGRGHHGLVVRLRLLPRRSLLGRPRIPGGCQDLWLADALCGDRAAGRHGHVHRGGPRLGTRILDAWRRPRAGSGDRADVLGMAARPSLQRLSLERLWLHAGLAALVCARGLTRRHVGRDVFRNRSLRVAGGARGRPHPYQASLDRTGAFRCRAGGARGLRRAAARAEPDRLRRRREAAHHAAQSAAGREIQLRAKTVGYEPLSRIVGPRQRTTVDGRARRDPSDLAGIGVPVLPDARSRCAGGDRGIAAAGNDIDHRRDPPA